MAARSQEPHRTPQPAARGSEKRLTQTGELGQQHADSPTVLKPIKCTESNNSSTGNGAAGKQTLSAEKYIYT